MTRLRGQHDLNDLSGKLTGGFNGVLLARLEAQFAATGPDAQKVLSGFRAAAASRETRENEFNQRARPQGLDLKRNLRNTEQMQALRAFNAAREHLIEAHPVLGQRIATMVEKDAVVTSRPAATIRRLS